MRYVNNWLTPLTEGFAPGDTVLPVSGQALGQMAPGDYLLSLTTSTNPAEQTAWEIIAVTVTGGLASVTARGQEGTIEQEWFPGALVYCAVTAGTLNALSIGLTDLQTQLTDLVTAIGNELVGVSQQIQALTLRVAALESGTPPDPGGGDGLLADSAGNVLTDDQNRPLQAAAAEPEIPT
ncbi:hypothetical protein [Pseudomonas sp. TMB3-21]